MCSLRFVTDGTLPQTLTSLRVRQLRELPSDCVEHVTQLQQLHKLELSGSASSGNASQISSEVRRLFSLPCVLLPRLIKLQNW